MKRIFLMALIVFIFFAFAACSLDENSGAYIVGELNAQPIEMPNDNEPPSAIPELPYETDYQMDYHPFARALAEFFEDAVPLPSGEDFPFSTHAILIDMDGNGTLGMVATKLTSWVDWESEVRYGFSQKLFYIYNGELHNMDRWYGGLTVTPSGRLVFVDVANACNMSQELYTLTEFVNGELAPTVALFVYTGWYHGMDENKNYVWDNSTTFERIVHLAYPTEKIICKEEHTFNSWELSDETFEQMRLLENDEIYETLSRYDLLSITRAMLPVPGSYLCEYEHMQHTVSHLPDQQQEILAMMAN